MKSILTYYGGKQKLATKIIELIPPHTLYAEPFAGGAAVFFNKRPSRVEVLNDTNGELINLYRVVKEKSSFLSKEISLTLHSRQLHQHARVVYNYPELFDEVKRAWAVWVLSQQSFSSRLDGSWGFDISDFTTTEKTCQSKLNFTELFALRLERTQLENAEALYIIQSRDGDSSFFYCDPPYFNSDMGHYRGYTKNDFIQLLWTLSGIKGKFLLSSYPSGILKEFSERFAWNQQVFQQTVSVNVKSGTGKMKTEVLTANYPLEKNPDQLTLF